MKRIRRVLMIGTALLVLFILSHASFSGVLFPWSPVRPGYASVSFPGATVVYPKGSGLPDAYRDTKAILAEVERANRLRFRKPVTIVVTDDWGLFNRGALLGRRATPLPVLGAALQTGTVIYLSPLIREPGRDPAGVLRHELTHAVLFQQMPLRRTFALVRLDWFEEGLAVHAGNPRDYLDDGEWRRRAMHPAYRFGPWGDPDLARVPEEMRVPFRLAEYRVFIEYLMERHGEDRFFAFRDAVLRDPDAHDAAFVRHFGAGFAAVAADFERAVRAGDWPRGNAP